MDRVIKDCSGWSVGEVRTHDAELLLLLLCLMLYLLLVLLMLLMLLVLLMLLDLRILSRFLCRFFMLLIFHFIQIVDSTTVSATWHTILTHS